MGEPPWTLAVLLQAAKARGPQVQGQPLCHAVPWQAVQELEW